MPGGPVGTHAGGGHSAPPGHSGWDFTDQFASELRVSPPLRVPSAHQVVAETESLMKWTDPSPKPTFTPPGWLLVGGDIPAYPPQPCVVWSVGLRQVSKFGVL